MKIYVKIGISIVVFTIAVMIATSVSVSGLHVNTDNAWIGYWGAVLGGCLTLVGVQITINENRKQIKDSRNQQVLPAFVSYKTKLTLNDMKSIGNDTPVYCIYDASKGTVSAGNPFINYINEELKDESPTLQKFESDYLAFRYKIENIGCGSALRICFDIHSLDPEEYIGIQVGESREIVLLLKSEESNPMHIRIKIDFENVYGEKYYQEEFLHYQKREDRIVDIRENKQRIGLSEVKPKEKQ